MLQARVIDGWGAFYFFLCPGPDRRLYALIAGFAPAWPAPHSLLAVLLRTQYYNLLTSMDVVVCFDLVDVNIKRQNK